MTPTQQQRENRPSLLGTRPSDDHISYGSNITISRPIIAHRPHPQIVIRSGWSCGCCTALHCTIVDSVTFQQCHPLTSCMSQACNPVSTSHGITVGWRCGVGEKEKAQFSHVHTTGITVLIFEFSSAHSLYAVRSVFRSFAPVWQAAFTSALLLVSRP